MKFFLVLKAVMEFFELTRLSLLTHYIHITDDYLSKICIKKCWDISFFHPVLKFFQFHNHVISLKLKDIHMKVTYIFDKWLTGFILNL